MNSRRKVLPLLAVLVAFSLSAGCAENPGAAAIAGGGKNTVEASEMYVTVTGNTLKITPAHNSSVEALVAILKTDDITYTADDYGDFEKVGNIGHSLPRNDESITTQAGDVILYQGNSICLYYGTNSWNFTRIGKIEGYSADELCSLLGAGKGEVKVTLSLQ